MSSNSSVPLSVLDRAYAEFQGQALRSAPAMGFVNGETLVALDRLAATGKVARLAELRQDLLDRLVDPALVQQPDMRRAFKDVYDEASDLAFPTTTAFLAQCEAIGGLTANVSLQAVDLGTLREIDEKAHGDAAFATFVRQLRAKLAEVRSPPDAARYGQFFEIYGEAVVLLRLRAKGIKVRRVPEGNASMPDFECETEDGRRFFIEVKSLDVVDGSFRQKEMMFDALDSEVELERQAREGCRISSTMRVVSPFRKSGSDPDYDSRSLVRVIDTFKSKWRQAFKASQFEQGPTFGLALVDRLLVPGEAQSLAPYYHEPAQQGACVSGVLWQAAYGREGGPVLRLCDFEGGPALEGHLRAPGVFVDRTQPFGAVGLIILGTHRGRRVAYGLASPDRPGGHWTTDQTEEVLGTLCDAWNDEGHSRGFQLADPIADRDRSS